MLARIGTNLSASLVIQMLNILTGVLLARQLGPRDRGSLVAIMLIPILVSAAGNFGISNSLTVWAAQDDTPKETLFGTGLVIAALQSVPAIVLATALVFVLGPQFTDHRQSLAFGYCAFIPLFFLTMSLASLLNGWGRVIEFNIVRISVVVLNATFLVVAALLSEISVTVAASASLAANALTLLVCFALTTKVLSAYPTFSPPLTKSLFRFGARSYPGTLAQIINERSDQLIIGIFLNPLQLGLYAVATTLSSAPALLGASISMASLPAASAARDRFTQIQSTRRILMVTIMLASILAAPVFLCAPLLLNFFFGPDFTEAQTATRILAVAGIMLAVTNVLSAVLIGLGHPGKSSLGLVCGLTVTLSGLLILVPRWGITGAAIVSFATYSLTGVWMFTRICNSLDAPVSVLLAWSRADMTFMANNFNRTLLKTKRRAVPQAVLRRLTNRP